MCGGRDEQLKILNVTSCDYCTVCWGCVCAVGASVCGGRVPTQKCAIQVASGIRCKPNHRPCNSPTVITICHSNSCRNPQPTTSSLSTIYLHNPPHSFHTSTTHHTPSTPTQSTHSLTVSAHLYCLPHFFTVPPHVYNPPLAPHLCGAG